MRRERDGAPATIEEVAAAAGVSRSTVSRVVNGSSAVSPAALAAVRRAISELAYVPNRAARTLASSRTNAIGLVVPEETDRIFGDPYFAAVVAGVSARLRSTPYVLNLFFAGDGSGDKMAGYIGGGYIDGAIIVSHHRDDAFVQRIADAVPVVFGGRPAAPHADSHYVDADNVAAARAATEYLLGRGHRRIATVTGPQTMSAGRDRLQGYREALAAAGVDAAQVEDGAYTTAGGAEAMRRILDDGDRPDAVFVASDLMARGALTALADRGISVPSDIALVGFDDSPIATSVWPRLTTIRQPSFEMGGAMANVLLDLLAGRTAPTATIMPAELVVRDSA